MMAMACGAVKVKFLEPKRFGRMPTLRISFFVMSMDHNGHVIWPTSFNPRTQAALRLQARTHLAAMLADSMYPTDPRMVTAMTGTSSALLRDTLPRPTAAHVPAAAAASNSE